MGRTRVTPFYAGVYPAFNIPKVKIILSQSGTAWNRCKKN